MDAKQFDSVARTLSDASSRRTVLFGLASTVLAALPLAADAKKKKRKKKKGSPPPPPGPSCSDGTKNGSETDIDCGGPTCQRCATGRICARNTDCATSRCGDGQGGGNTCRICTGDGVCGLDARGGCNCNEQTGACLSDFEPPQFFGSCPACPAGSICISFFEGDACVPLCGG